MATLDLVAKDTASSLQVNLFDQDGNALDLTGATPQIQFYIDSYSDVNPVKVKAMTTVGTPTNGVVKYQFTVDNSTTPPTYDLSAPGILYYKIQVTFPDSTVITTPFQGEITIHESLT